MWARVALGAVTGGWAGGLIFKQLNPRPDWSDLEAATDTRAEKWLVSCGVHPGNTATILERVGYNLEDLRRVAVACKGTKNGAAFYEAVDDTVETLIKEKERAVQAAVADLKRVRAYDEGRGETFMTPCDEVIRLVACNATPTTGPFYFDDRFTGPMREIVMASDTLRFAGLARLDHKTATYTVTNRLVHEAMQRYTSKP